MKQLMLAILVMGVQLVQAQYTTVKYDAASNWFNQGQPLPAEVGMVFLGPVSRDVQLVELSFLEAKKQDELFTGQWQRLEEETEFALPVNYKLRSESSYDVQLSYFTATTDAARQQLKEQLLASLELVLQAQQKEKLDIDFRRNHKKIVASMNDLLAEQFVNYRSLQANWSPSLSDLVALQLEQLERANLDQNYNRKDTTQTRQAVRTQARTSELDKFRQLLQQEINTLMDVPLYRLHQTRVVDNYRTESKAGVLALNLGYGGVYLSGKWTDGQYGAAPYAGIAIPLGNRVLGTKFLRNTAINTGVFLTTLDNGNGQEAEGFLIKQPLYLGLDYRLFQFVRFNAGTVLLNGNTLMANESAPGDQQLTLRPFIGLSARINLQLGLGK